MKNFVRRCLQCMEDQRNPRFCRLTTLALVFVFAFGGHPRLEAQSVENLDLIQAPPDMPLYTLTAMSVTNRFGKPSVMINYERKTPGLGMARLAGKTADGPLKLAGFGMLTDNQGTIELSNMFPNGGRLDAELYLVASGTFADEVAFQCLVSNVVKVGNYAGNTMAREWNAREKQAYEKDLKGHRPPATPPAGYKIVPANVKLLPGMTAKVGYYGDWVDAEILSDAARVTVKLMKNGSLRLIQREGWISATPEEMQKIVSSPNTFIPSVVVLPNTTTAVPDGYLPISADMPIVAGVPVRAMWHLKYADATIVSVDGSKLLVHIDGMDSAFDQKMERGTVLISRDLISKLNDSEAKETFAKRIPKATSMDEKQAQSVATFDAAFERAEKETERLRKKIEEDIARQNADFDQSMKIGIAGAPKLPLLLQPAPVTLRVPKEAEPVPFRFKLPKGTKLAACWGPQWSPLTVLEETEDDDVPIHWDQLGHDAKINRSQLIIRKADLKKVKQETAKATPRTWRDATGKFSVEATFVAKTTTAITLRKNDGKEVTLQMAKLSKEDVQWIKENL